MGAKAIFAARAANIGGGILMRPTLYLYRLPSINVKKEKEEIVSDANPQEQAQILCALLISAIPSAVLRTFCDMTGANLQSVFDIGNEFEFDCASTKLTKLTEEDANEIRIVHLSLSQLAGQYGVSRSTISRIKSGKTHKEKP